MSSPVERVPSSETSSIRGESSRDSLARAHKGSHTSLSSLPSRIGHPSALKPPSADVQLDLSSASSETRQPHPSPLATGTIRLRASNASLSPSGTITAGSKATARTSIIQSNELWRSSAAKRAEKAWALQTEKALYTDSKFKKYLALVERTLFTFDNVSEWADFISFLSRLLKALQAYPNYNVIPRKLIVAKRLAQCLNPALPSGVHQRALDVYQHIFGVIGPDGLRRDLQIWTSGLLPFFQYASTSVKPTLLAIYETSYLPLQEDLRPLTKALQMALLPGLEEETSDYHDRTLALLDRISHVVTQAFFLQCLWLTLITTPAVRLAATNYLTRRMPSLEDESDPTRLVGKDLGLMVRGLSHALEDDNLLVRRNGLEVLVTHLKLQSPVFKKFIKTPDQVLLVRAALNVVLRKDLSLNRRLYSWLLGPEEGAEAQIKFLSENGLMLVRDALKQDFEQNHNNHADRQKPYRIFVSLLDKWEIGQSLTRVLALDAFQAISTQVARGQEEELITTAKMLFEVVDPFLLYGRFLDAIENQLRSSQVNGEEEVSTHVEAGIVSPVSLLCFVFKAFPIHDEETKQIHVPLLFSATAQLVESQLKSSEQSRQEEIDLQILDALELLKLLITVMPSRVFVRVQGRKNKDSENQASASDLLERARHFYSSSETDSQQAARNFFSFQNRESCTALVELLSNMVLLLGEQKKHGSQRANGIEMFVRMLDLFADLMRVIDGSEAQEEIALVGARADASPQKITWGARSWVTSLLPSLDSATTFAEVERIVEVLLSCNICRALQTPLDLNSPQILDRIVAKLMRYLDPAMSPYHVRAVELMWATYKVTHRSRLETALSHQINQVSESERIRALAAFGTFWRLSEDNSTDELRMPLLQVLDRLRSPDYETKQLAESWLRTNLRSYAKVVDPLLHMLWQSRPLTVAAMLDLQGVSVEAVQHVEPFTQQQVLYAMQTLLSLSRFGSQGFSRALGTTTLSASLSVRTKHFIKQEVVQASSSYLDAVLDECSRWIGLYPSAELRAASKDDNVAIRAAAVDLVQNLVQRGSTSRIRLEQLEKLLIESLLIAIDTGCIPIQNKMLHTLHTVLTARTSSSAKADRMQRRFSSTSQVQELHRQDDSVGRAEGSSPLLHQRGTSSSPYVQPHSLLLVTVQRALSTESNRSIMQHWSDFILMTLPHYRKSINSLLLPLNESVCHLIQKAISELASSYTSGPSRPTFGAELVVQSVDTGCAYLESDLALLINLSERTLMQAAGMNEDGAQLGGGREATSPLSGSTNEKVSFGTGQDGGSGLLGLVSNVFSSDSGSGAGKLESISENRSRSLQTTIRTLHGVWSACAIELSPTDAKSLSLETMMAKVRLRCRRAFERIYRAHPAESLECLVERWHWLIRGGKKVDKRGVEAVFEILEVIAPSAQILVSFLCDVLGTRLTKSDSERERTRRVSSSIQVSETALFGFMDAVLNRMGAAEAIQVWPVMIMFIKDFVSTGLSRKTHIYPVLRIFTTLGEKLCVTTSMEDRRVRRDLQDNYMKLIDSCILVSGRSFDQSTWIRRSGRDVVEELENEAAEFASEPWDEKVGPAENGGPVVGLIEVINQFLAMRGLPALRKLQMDSDKINGVVSNVVYYIIAPASRTKSRSLEVDPSILAVASEIVRMPGTVKAWRNAIGDLFADGRFFSMTTASAELWRPVVFALMTQDKERLPELLSKITATAAAANIFANRELEMLSKALNLRRLSFTIFSGEQDAFLTQLPSIQEKVVDLLRSNVSDVVHAEFYLCMRVLLMRFSGRHLSSFWPVLMTELMRLYDGLASAEDASPLSRDSLQLLLSTLKLLDLLVLLQPEDFQIHEWLFITDTIDAVYPSDDFQSETMLDQLATTFSKSTPQSGNSNDNKTKGAFGTTMGGAGHGGSGNPFSLEDSTHIDANDVRKRDRGRTLQLRHLKTIDSVSEVLPFLHSISHQSFEGNYSNLPIDYEDIEACLLSDMFDGDSNSTAGAGGVVSTTNQTLMPSDH